MLPNPYPRKDRSGGVLLHLAKLASFFFSSFKFRISQ